MKKTNLSKALRRPRDDERRGAGVHRLTLRGIALQRRISSELADELPHEFWHWLSDFDVRKKSAEVAGEQNAFIDELIRRLQSDERLDDEHAPTPKPQNQRRRIALTAIACLATAAGVTEMLDTGAPPARDRVERADAGVSVP